MTEITEYALAAMVSALFLGGSAATYASLARFEASYQADATLTTLIGLAGEAVESGRSSSNVLLPTSSFSCSGNTILMVIGNATTASTFPRPCEFHFSVSGGPHLVSFSYVSSVLHCVVV